MGNKIEYYKLHNIRQFESSKASKEASKDDFAITLAFLLEDIARVKKQQGDPRDIRSYQGYIRNMKKFLGKEKFAEIEKLAKKVGTKKIKAEERESYWIDKAVSGFFIFIGILIFWWMFLAEREECETVTYYEYGKKKTGQICGEARDQMNVIRDQKGIYKKGNDGLPEE